MNDDDGSTVIFQNMQRLIVTDTVFYTGVSIHDAVELRTCFLYWKRPILLLLTLSLPHQLF